MPFDDVAIPLPQKHTFGWHLPFHLPLILSHDKSPWYPFLHTQTPFVLFTDDEGQLMLLPSVHDESSYWFEYVRMPQSWQMPELVPLLPTRPLPAGHFVCSAHVLVSIFWSSHFPRDELQISHWISFVVLPVPAMRPCPEGQFFQELHVTAPVRGWYLPIAQRLQLDMSSLFDREFWYVPIWHLTHDNWFRKKPLLHDPHWLFPVLLILGIKFPSLHLPPYWTQRPFER